MGYRGGQFATQASSLERGLASLIIKSIGSTNCFPGDTLSTTEQRRLPDAHHSQEKSMVLRMRRVFQIVLLSGLTACGLVSSNAATVKNPIFGYELTTDVVYGQGAVTKDGEVVDRDLLIDVYTPTDESLTGPSLPSSSCMAVAIKSGDCGRHRTKKRAQSIQEWKIGRGY